MWPAKNPLPFVPELAYSKVDRERLDELLSTKEKLHPPTERLGLPEQFRPSDPPFLPVAKVCSKLPHPPSLLEPPRLLEPAAPAALPDTKLTVAPPVLNANVSKTKPFRRLVTVKVASVPALLTSSVTLAHGAAGLQGRLPESFVPVMYQDASESACAKLVRRTSTARETRAHIFLAIESTPAW